MPDIFIYPSILVDMLSISNRDANYCTQSINLELARDSRNNTRHSMIHSLLMAMVGNFFYSNISFLVSKNAIHYTTLGRGRRNKCLIVRKCY